MDSLFDVPVLWNGRGDLWIGTPEDSQIKYFECGAIIRLDLMLMVVFHQEKL